MLEVRRASAADAIVIADLHTVTWRDAYRGILPNHYLDGDMATERRTAWTRYFAAQPDQAAVLLAIGLDGALDGFIALEAGNENGYDAVIENLHVASRARGRGIAKRLIFESIDHLFSVNARSVCLWVYDDNEAAMSVYKALGGTADAWATDPFAHAHAAHTRIGWKDLATLRDRCRTEECR